MKIYTPFPCFVVLIGAQIAAAAAVAVKESGNQGKETFKTREGENNKGPTDVKAWVLPDTTDQRRHTVHSPEQYTINALFRLETTEA